MAFFKFRKGGHESPAAPPQPESVEAMRRRARHRLIGAAVLVLLGVIGFPLLFDTQPRPIAVDIPIEIPDRNKAKPLALPAQAQARSATPPTAVAAGPVTAAPVAAVTPPAPAVPAAPVAPVAPSPARTDTPSVTKAEAPLAPAAKPEPKPAKVEPKPAAGDDGAKARALLEGKPVEVAAASPAAGADRFIVQVGAFADSDKAREVRQKLESAGLKTYTHVADTKDGKRTRVRVGPFGTRADADKAADRIKGLDLPAAILTL